ncbi:hypothetical protein CMV_018361 [Castanea mollissima]|uniref:Uncharacterized protein n=1 Tax=Castanea mollissima TaxID=60419 RepID=A0A8J4VPN8_9ROSI|nr:hypothetical protein CMV_018361 [Castanea mollissima]
MLLFSPFSPETTEESSLLPKQRPSSLPRLDRGEKEFWASNPGPIGLAVAPTLKTLAIGVWVSTLILRFVIATLENPRSSPSVALVITTGDPEPFVALPGTAAGTGDRETDSGPPLEFSPVAPED